MKKSIVGAVCLVVMMTCYSLFSAVAWAQVDYGDLPDSFSTSSENAPSHMLVGSAEDQLRLGEGITADSVHLILDEDDGVVERVQNIMIAGSSTLFEVDVQGPIPSEGAFLGVWIDWEHDGVFDPHDFSSHDVENGVNMIAVPVSIPYYPEALAARFRLFAGDQLIGDSLDWTDFEGGTLNGEVEDYVYGTATGACILYPRDTYYDPQFAPEICSVEVATASDETPRDFGDLPDSYSSISGAYAPSHISITVGDQLHLGTLFTTESAPMPNTFADADASDDGIRFITPLSDSQLSLSASLTGTIIGDGATIAFWVDWDNNGQFDENEFQMFPVTHGTNDIILTTPADHVRRDGSFAMRVRLFDNVDFPTVPVSESDNTVDITANNSLDWTDFDGVAINGEIEDYIFVISLPTTPTTPTAVTLHTLSTTTLTPLLIIALFAFVTLFSHRLIKQ